MAAKPVVSEGTDRVKKGLPQMCKGGVIMDVMNAEQAKIAEAAGACAVMALERIPADIRQSKGVARMSDPKMIKEIVNAVSIPVMAKARIGHIVEAQILQELGVDCIDERKFSLLQMRTTTLIKTNSRCLLCAAAGILARRFDALLKAAA